MPLKFYVIDCVKPKQGFGPPFSANSQPITNVYRRPMTTDEYPNKSLIREGETVKRESRFDV
jgi:hypothetical protein